MTEPKPPTHGLTVLVVDDDEGAGNLAVAHLKREGYDAVYAADGETGVAVAAKVKPDLILLDLMMPGIDGFEACIRLRAKVETKQTPIIILSSQRERNQVLRALQNGADDFIIKPLDPPVLLHKLKSILRKRNPTVPDEAAVEKEDNREFVRLGEVAEATIEFPLEIVDISEGGIALNSESSIPVGKTFTINSPLLKEILEREDIPIRITYSVRESASQSNRLGAEFVGLPESGRKRIRQYIFKRQTERVRVK